MKKIDFTYEGGFPLRQNTLKFMQESQEELLKAFLGYLGGLSSFESPGQNLIVYGLRKTESGQGSPGHPYVTAGWLIRGEALLYFAGAFEEDIESAGGIGVEEQWQSRTFHDADSSGQYTHPVYQFKKAVVGGLAPLDLSFYRRVRGVNDFRDILKINFQAFVPMLPNGESRTITYFNQNIKAGDAAVVQLGDAGPETALVVLNAQIITDGQLKITLINNNQSTFNQNQNSTGGLFGGEVMFKARIIK